MSEVVRKGAEVRPLGAFAVPARTAVPIALGAIVAVATVVHALLGLGLPSPWIVPDELIYSELAKSLGAGGWPRIRDEAGFVVGPAYPAILAPVWGLVDDTSTAYTLSKVLNALILSFTAVPAYFLARRFVDTADAVLVAALSVAVPSLVYAGTLMTEVALYPAFVLALLAIAVAVERPTGASQAAAFATIGLAASIKMLAAVLLVAYVAAAALYHWLDSRGTGNWLGRMRAYSLTFAALAIVGLAAGVLALASGRGPADTLGAYAVVLDNIDLSAIPRWTALHVAELDLYLAVIPFAATVGACAQGFRTNARDSERLLAAVVVPVCAALLVTVAAFASTSTPGGEGYPENVSRLHERSTFFLAPLFLLGLVVFLRHRTTRSLVMSAIVGVAALLPALIPIDDFDGNVRFQALALVPWVELGDAAWPLGVLAFTGALGGFFLLALRARWPARLVVVPVVLVFVGVTAAAHSSMQWASQWTRSAAWGTTPDWVDAAVPAGSTVSVLWAEPPGEHFVDLAPRHRIVLVGEFFNRSLGSVYELGSPMPYGLPTTEVALAGDRVVTAEGRPADLGSFLLAPCYVRVVGAPVARDPGTGAHVDRVGYPLRARVTSPDSC